MTRAAKIHFLRVFVGTGFILASLYHFVLLGQYLGLGYPFNTFLFNPAAFGSDFLNTFRQTQELNPYLGANIIPSNFFPFTHVVVFPFTIFGLYPAYLIFSVGTAAFLWWLGQRYLRANTFIETSINIVLIVFLSYPFLFQIERGNVELLSFVFLCLFVLFYQKRAYYWASVWISCAVAMKLYPAIFLLLFVVDKKYRQLGLSLLLVPLLTVGALLLFQNPIAENWNCLMYILKTYNHHFVENNAGLPFGHSLFGMIKIIAYAYGNGPVLNFGGGNFRMAYLLGALLCGILLLPYLRRETECWKRIAMLVLALDILPFASGDYRLINMFMPCLLFVSAKRTSGFDRYYALLFGLLLIPKSYYHFWNPEITSEALLSPALSLVLVALLVSDLYREQRFYGAFPSALR